MRQKGGLVTLRPIFEHHRRLAGLLVVLFGFPLPAISLVSGLHWGFAVVLFALVVGVWWGYLHLLQRRGDGSTRPVGPLRLVWTGIAASVSVALLIQAVPYGGSTQNPPIVAEPAWDSAATRELAVKACFDCHSNEVEYPWYSEVAPIKWAVQRHVDAGRDDVNYSEWNRNQKKARESAETVEEGSMPPWYYTLVRPGLLSEGEKRDLIRGLEATLGREEGDEHEDDEDDD